MKSRTLASLLIPSISESFSTSYYCLSEFYSNFLASKSLPKDLISN